MKPLKYAIAAALVLAVAVSLVLAYLVLTLDARDYEPRIAALVKEKTGRTLLFRGETHVSLWPDLGVTLGPVALTERGSDAIFAEIANARVVAKLAPLLDRQLVADELHVEDASVHIVRDEQGRLNIDDLLGGERSTLTFDIARARFERSRVTFEDLARGTRHDLEDVDVTTGRLARGVATPVTLAFVARDAANAYALKASVEGRLAFESDRRHYAFDDVRAQLRGTVVRGHEIDARVALRSLMVDRGAITCEGLSGDFRSGELRVGLAVPRVDWREGIASAAGAVMELDGARDARQLHAKLSADVRADSAKAFIELADLRSSFTASGRGLPKRGIEGALTGAVSAGRDRADAALAGTVFGSRVKAKLAAPGYGAAPYTFAVDVDALDLDRLDSVSASTASGGGFDPASLRDVRAAGTVRVATLKSGGVVAKNVQLAMKP